MMNLTPELREGETVIREAGTTVYMVRDGMSTRGSNIRMWLTDQRLILKAGLGPQRTLPLSHITRVTEQKVAIHNMLRVDFDDNHSEWFTVQDQTQFIELLEQARIKAPELAYEPTPKGIAGKLFGIPLMIIAGIMVLVCICMIAFFLFSGWAFFWLGGN
jgi:hypothetical protein